MPLKTSCKLQITHNSDSKDSKVLFLDIPGMEITPMKIIDLYIKNPGLMPSNRIIDLVTSIDLRLWVKGCYQYLVS